MTDSPQVAALKEKYHRSLTTKAETAFEWVESCRLEWATSDAPKEIAAWLHQLAGSAGMYGYDRVAAQARTLLGALRGGGAAAPATQIHRELLQLGNTLAECAKD